MTEIPNIVYYPLQLNWTSLRQTLDFGIFEYKDEYRDNFTFMLSDLCQDPSMISTRIYTFVSDLFAMSSSETNNLGYFEKLDKLMVEIEQEKSENDAKALKICSEAIMLDSSEALWKYLVAILHGLKADAHFLNNQLHEMNSFRMEMLKIFHDYKLFDSFDLTYMILQHCSQLLERDTTAHFVPQIIYLLKVAKHFLDNAKLEDDIDGMKYQKLRKYWHVIVSINEGQFLDKSWKEFKVEGNKPLEAIKNLKIDPPESPEIPEYKVLTKAEDFLDRKSLLEEHHVKKFEFDEYIKGILMKVSNYAQAAYESVKEKPVV